MSYINMSKSYYDVLGVDRNASKDDIKKAYKSLAVKMHPDKGGDADQFKEISSAYETLYDDDKRRAYDNPQPNINMNDIFDQFFRHNPFSQPRRPEHVHNLNISLKEAYHGIKKTLKIESEVPCRHCSNKCTRCNGSGVINEVAMMGFMIQKCTRGCEICSGKGCIAKGCTHCQHKGMLKQEQTINVEIPPGIDSGATLAVGRDFAIVLNIEQGAVFRREGPHLVYKDKITFGDSVVGKILTVPHLDTDITFDTSEWGILRPDKKYRVSKKGMPVGNGDYGDLFIEFEIDYPKLTEMQRQILTEAFEKICVSK